MSKKKRTPGRSAAPDQAKIIQKKRDQVAAILAVMFGLISVVEGGRVLLGVWVPDYPVLPWLVWYNVAMGAVSAVVGVGLWLRSERARSFAINILTLHAIVFAGLFAMKLSGQVVAMKSVFAMMFRTFAWIVITLMVRWKRPEGE